MVTPILIDGFEHQTKDLNGFGGTFETLWHTAVEGTATFPAGRNGVCIQFSPTGSTIRGYKRLNDPTAVVCSVYIKVTANPASDQQIMTFQNAGFTNAPNIQLRSTGVIRVTMSTIVDGPNISDGLWHRLDLRTNLSANPWVLDWQVDGVTQTQITLGLAASAIRFVQIGGASATCTYAFDDLVLSSTVGDYPMGPHDVLYGVPNGDGTHNAGTNTIEDNAGTDIVSPNAFPLLDEWPANTSDYIQQSTIGAGNYAEVTFADAPAGKDIWGVEGVAALFSSGVNANSGTTRIVDAAGATLTDIYAGDMSETSLHFRRAMIVDPGGDGWTKTEYDGLKARVGFSGDVTDVPRWSALMLQYAITDSVAGAGVVADPFGMSGFFGA